MRLNQWLPPKHQARLKELVKAEAEADRLTELLQVVLSALPGLAGSPEQRGLMRVLDNALVALLARGDDTRAGLILNATRQLLASESADQLRSELNHVASRAGNEKAVNAMIDRFSRTKDDAEAGLIAHVIALLDPVAAEFVTDRLDNIPPERLPKLQQALKLMCERRPWRLTPGLRSERVAVVLATIRVLRQIRTDQSRNELRPLADHDEPVVRVAVIEALATHHARELYDVVQRLVTDPDPDVRLAVLDSCRQLPQPQAARTLITLLQADDLRERPHDEQAHLFDLLAEQPDESIVAALAQRLDPKRASGLRERARQLASKVLHRETHDELIEPVARALCLIGTPAAHKALIRAKTNGTPHTRQVVERVLAIVESAGQVIQ